MPVEVNYRFWSSTTASSTVPPPGDLPPGTWSAWRDDPSWRPPGGETLVELGERVARALGDLAVEATGRDVVVVTHVSPVKAAVAWALGVGIDISWRCHVDQATITRVAVDGASPSLRSFNERAHLASLDQPPGGR